MSSHSQQQPSANERASQTPGPQSQPPQQYYHPVPGIHPAYGHLSPFAPGFLSHQHPPHLQQQLPGGSQHHRSSSYHLPQSQSAFPSPYPASQAQPTLAPGTQQSTPAPDWPQSHSQSSRQPVGSAPPPHGFGTAPQEASRRPTSIRGISESPPVTSAVVPTNPRHTGKAAEEISVRWHYWMEELLAETLIKEKEKLPNKTRFNLEVYGRVAKVINDELDKRPDSGHGRLTAKKVDNKKFALNKDFYQPLRMMKNKTGWGAWDNVNYRPIIEDGVWEDLMRDWVGTPTKAQMNFLRENGWALFPLWDKVRDGVGATGDFAVPGGGNPPSSTPRRAQLDDTEDDDADDSQRSLITPTPSKSSRGGSVSGSARSRGKARAAKRRRDDRSPSADAVSEISRSYLEGIQAASKRVTTDSVKYLKEDLAEMDVDDGEKRLIRLQLARDRVLMQSYIDQPKEDRQELLLGLLLEIQSRDARGAR
ncbi:hypothetical protein FFLO_05978 [Filobasidium floriforme]|uniref:Myb/SANT-like domain-containing protein n=1 Tax=Filobasidium floriforme TaxID=5210 RepID=A0A8K0JFT8_9TREE|nr:hypothetical protein FFLO_05978 [Filobasidium floriforme]